jgi:hypothetical protein
VISPSLFRILDDNDNDNVEEEDIITGLFKVKCSLRGDALAKFDFLMDIVASRDESIEELTSHIENEKRRFNLCRGINESDATWVAYRWWLTMMTLEHLDEICTRHDVPRFGPSRWR